jgi:hypothetical protein
MPRIWSAETFTEMSELHFFHIMPFNRDIIAKPQSLQHAKISCLDPATMKLILSNMSCSSSKAMVGTALRG